MQAIRLRMLLAFEYSNHLVLRRRSIVQVLNRVVECNPASFPKKVHLVVLHCSPLQDFRSRIPQAQPTFAPPLLHLAQPNAALASAAMKTAVSFERDTQILAGRLQLAPLRLRSCWRIWVVVSLDDPCTAVLSFYNDRMDNLDRTWSCSWRRCDKRTELDLRFA